MHAGALWKYAYDHNASHALEIAIRNASKEQQRKLINKLIEEFDIVSLCSDIHATYVIQLIIIELPEFRTIVARSMKEKFVEIASDERGGFVLHRMLEVLSDEDVKENMLFVFKDKEKVQKLNESKTGRSLVNKMGARKGSKLNKLKNSRSFSSII